MINFLHLTFWIFYRKANPEFLSHIHFYSRKVSHEGSKQKDHLVIFRYLCTLALIGCTLGCGYSYSQIEVIPDLPPASLKLHLQGLSSKASPAFLQRPDGQDDSQSVICHLFIESAFGRVCGKGKVKPVVWQ
jgi:hypothetical protein